VSAPFIRCRDLEKSFNGKAVLRGMSLDVMPGETLVLLGGSGSGKSVILKHMNGLLRPDRGAVEVEGVDLAPLDEDGLIPIRRKVSMLFQQGALFDSLTIGDNVAYPLREHHLVSEDQMAARVREALDMVGLAGTEHQMPSELSGGMRKRAALARSLVLEPRAVLYDEPTTGLDPVTSAKISHLIRDVQGRVGGITSVVVTHDIASAFLVADRIAFLADGRIRFIGSPDEARASRDPALHEFLTAA
jgi:phospholipid/cholesterol/gamma-HCH transport system ATP-binding protein